MKVEGMSSGGTSDHTLQPKLVYDRSNESVNSDATKAIWGIIAEVCKGQGRAMLTHPCHLIVNVSVYSLTRLLSNFFIVDNIEIK